MLGIDWILIGKSKQKNPVALFRIQATWLLRGSQAMWPMSYAKESYRHDRDRTTDNVFRFEIQYEGALEAHVENGRGYPKYANIYSVHSLSAVHSADIEQHTVSRDPYLYQLLIRSQFSIHSKLNRELRPNPPLAPRPNPQHAKSPQEPET
ncbi:hypothetical protein BJX99DRAFT_218488, partial [Aspergillus californicus]